MSTALSGIVSRTPRHEPKPNRFLTLVFVAPSIVLVLLWLEPEATLNEIDMLSDQVRYVM